MGLDVFFEAIFGIFAEILTLLFQALIEAVFQVLFEIPCGVLRWFWNHAFSGDSGNPKRAEIGEVVEPSESSSYLWDRDVDGV